MQAVVKVPHIRVNIKGDIFALMVEVLKKEYGKNLIKELGTSVEHFI